MMGKKLPVSQGFRFHLNFGIRDLLGSRELFIRFLLRYSWFCLNGMGSVVLFGKVTFTIAKELLY